MADEDINPVVLLADPKVNHRVWAACLKWTPVVKKQRVPSHHKHKSHVKPRRLTSLKMTFWFVPGRYCAMNLNRPCPLPTELISGSFPSPHY